VRPRLVHVATVACSIAALLAARAAIAGTKIVFQSGDGGRTTWFAESTRVRVQGLDRDSEDLGFIVDLASRDLVFVDDADQSYFDAGTFFKHAGKKAAAAQRVMRERAREAESPFAYVPSHEKRTIGAFSCDTYAGFRGGRLVEEVCTVPWNDPAVGAKKDYAFLETAFDVMWARITGTRKAPKSTPGLWTGTPGLAVWRQAINEDHSRGAVTEIESLTRGAIPAAIFSVPVSYHESDGLPDRDRPNHRVFAAPTGTAVSDVAMAASEVATRDGRRLTGIFLILMIGVGTIGLALHALLVHFAAIVVIEEPRYIDALVATLAVWVVGVPLSLIGAWLPVAVPVEMLATYAGLRMSYRASHARTVALLAVSTLVALLVAAGLAFLSGSFR
jgi:hypothetical protein